jgi:hypothetical protein
MTISDNDNRQSSMLNPSPALWSMVHCTLLSDMHIWIATKQKKKGKDEEERDTAKPQKENEEIQWRAR